MTRRKGTGAAAALIFLLTVLVVAPTALGAVTSVWREGVPGRPFTVQSLENGVTVADGTDQSVMLKQVVSWRIDAGSPTYAGVDPLGVDPRCIQPLGGGRALIVNRRLASDDATAFIAVVRRDGTEEWSYRPSDDPQLGKPFCAERFVRDGRTYTLIADRDAARVFAVDATKRVVWQYGVVGDPGLGVDRLSDPYWATYTGDDTVLIADNLGGHRVIEVRWEDYEAGAADHGFTVDSVVWQYGVSGVPGSAAGQLMKPRSPQRLPGDARHTLITDADAHVVYEVDRAGRIVWRFGRVGEPGRPQDGRLRDPTYAERLDDGTTLIADTGNGLVVRVNMQGDVVASYDLAMLDRPEGTSATDAPEPRMATPAADGSLLIADSGFARFVEIGLPAQASFTSRPLDMGSAGAGKRFLSLSWAGETPGASGVRLSYSIDGGAWTALRAGTYLPLPASAVGKRLQYRVTLVSDRRTTGPRIDSIEVRWQKVVQETERNDAGAVAKGPGVAYMGGAGGPSGSAGAVVWGVNGTGSGTSGQPGGGGGARRQRAPTRLARQGRRRPTSSSPAARKHPRWSRGVRCDSPGPVVRAATAVRGYSPGARGAFWAVLAAVLVTAAVMPPIAGRRLRDRLTVPTEVPATATRDARLLKGAG